MTQTQASQRSAVVFGARNLRRAVIELLVSDGWAVTGVARSQSTLDGVRASGALALEADVTDPASVYGVLNEAAAAHGGVELVLNAAAAYGGERAQSRCSSQASGYPADRLCAGRITRSSSARWAADDVPPIASTTG
jgi:NADP-dependent 3-hydroxy acid dehydrogenase YdfG